MTALKDDGDDNNSRVPDKTDILHHSYCTLYIRKITKTNKQSSASYYSDLQRHCVFLNKSEEKEVRKFFRYLFKEHEYTACLNYNI